MWMWELEHKVGWAVKNWCFLTVMLEKTLESPLDCKVIKPVNPKGNHSWIIIGRTDAEAETPILWPPDAKNWLVSPLWSGAALLSFLVFMTFTHSQVFLEGPSSYWIKALLLWPSKRSQLQMQAHWKLGFIVWI